MKIESLTNSIPKFPVLEVFLLNIPEMNFPAFDCRYNSAAIFFMVIEAVPIIIVNKIRDNSDSATIHMPMHFILMYIHGNSKISIYTKQTLQPCIPRLMIMQNVRNSIKQHKILVITTLLKYVMT